MEQAIKSLADDETIDIKLDDKSGAFVVADPEDYISAVTNDLNKLRQIEELPADLDKGDIIKKVELEITKDFLYVPRINISMSQTQTQSQSQPHWFPAFVMLTFFYSIIIIISSNTLPCEWTNHRAGSQLKISK